MEIAEREAKERQYRAHLATRTHIENERPLRRSPERQNPYKRELEAKDLKKDLASAPVDDQRRSTSNHDQIGKHNEKY